MLHPPVARASISRQTQLSTKLSLSDRDLEAFQSVLLARASSSCASESSFQDASSEVGSLGSSVSNATDVLEGQVEVDPSVAQPSQEQALAEMSKQLEEAQNTSMQAETAAKELAARNLVLLERIKELEMSSQRSALQSDDSPGDELAANEIEARVEVARLVAAATAKASSVDEAETRWKGEVELLRRRAERSAKMETAMDQQRQQQQKVQEAFVQRAIHVGFALSCASLGGVAAFLAIRSLRKQ